MTIEIVNCTGAKFQLLTKRIKYSVCLPQYDVAVLNYETHSHQRPRNYLLPHRSLLAAVRPLAKVREKLIYSRRLERLWIFVEEYYSDPAIQLRNAAKHSGVSPDHLNVLLRRFGDTSFHNFLSRYRVEKCLELVHEKNYTLTEIYSRCGFNSPSTFGRQFKKWVGCLPSEYKRLVRVSESTGSQHEC